MIPEQKQALARKWARRTVNAILLRLNGQPAQADIAQKAAEKLDVLLRDTETTAASGFFEALTRNPPSQETSGSKPNQDKP